jgi:hypothetical protein
VGGGISESIKSGSLGRNCGIEMYRWKQNGSDEAKGGLNCVNAWIRP